MNRVFALIDANSFYASCEQIFRPDLTNKPVVVLSNNDGCIVARSAQAKALGIPMGAPFFKWQAFLRHHQVAVFSSNYELYADMSERMMQTIAAHAPRIEVYSIDECFADLSGVSDTTAQGQLIRRRVYQWLKLPTGIGIGPTKVLAKLANHLAKTQPQWQGVCDLNIMSLAHRQQLLANIDVGEVWGVGKNLAITLRQLGIQSALDLSLTDFKQLRRHTSVVVERIARELHGESCLSLDEVQSAKKQIIRSRSFGQLLTECESIAAAVAHHISNAATALREQQSMASCVSVFLHTNRFKKHNGQYHASRSVSLAVPSADSLLLNQQAQLLLRQLYRAGFAYKKVGVMLSGIEPVCAQQADLFADAECEKNTQRSNQLMAVLDQLNKKFGRETVQLASCLQGNDWRMLNQRVSPRYTTNIAEILVIK